MDGLPTTTSDSLNTQAFLKENQSLLVGGIVREESDADESGVPGLKDIPLIGPLFKQRSKSKIKMKRLFLITPKIVTASYDTDALKPYFDTFKEADPNHPTATPALHCAPDSKMDLRPAPQLEPVRDASQATPVKSATTVTGQQSASTTPLTGSGAIHDQAGVVPGVGAESSRPLSQFQSGGWCTISCAFSRENRQSRKGGYASSMAGTFMASARA